MRLDDYSDDTIREARGELWEQFCNHAMPPRCIVCGDTLPNDATDWGCAAHPDGSNILRSAEDEMVLAYLAAR